MTNYTAAIVAINTSTLPLSTRYNARTLLDMVHPDNGFICLCWADVLAIFRVKTIGGAREHLTRMQQIGLIRYSSDPTEDTVDIRFKAFAPRAASDLTRGRVDPTRGSGDLPPDLTRVPLGEILNTGIGIERDIPPSLPSRVGAPGPQTGPPAEPTDTARIVALLTDPEVGLSKVAAEKLTDASLKEVALQVFRFEHEHAANLALGPGVLTHRIRHPADFPATITAADRASPLWARHLTGSWLDENTEAARKRKYDLYGYEEQRHGKH